MDFTKTRCPVCYKHFCCSAHRSDHQVKFHTKAFTQKHNKSIVTVFQKKAQSSLLRTQNHHEIKNIIRQSQVTTVHIKAPTAKRLHSAMNKRILSTAVALTSQKRKILVPVHRLRSYSVLTNDENAEIISQNSNEVVEQPPVPQYVDRSVKTSTPIISPLPNYISSDIKWNISSESTISNYQTPSGPSPSYMAEKSSKGQTTVTPLRSIISKSSKYDSSSDSGPSPGTNTSRSRRVTFSSSSQMSFSSTPLESIQEVEVYEEIKNTYSHIQGIRKKVKSRCNDNREMSDNFVNIRMFLEDSTPPTKDNGFLSCVTNMFCSAFHTIPSLAPWRKTDTDSMLNRSKRSRSPDSRDTHYLDIETPLHKRPCYPSDLRINPIKCRRPISEK